MQISNEATLAEGRVSRLFLRAIEMGEMYSREAAVTLGESMVCRLPSLLETQQVESVVHHRFEAVRPIDAVSPSSRPCLYLAAPAQFCFRPVSACSRLGGLLWMLVVARQDRARRLFPGRLRHGWPNCGDDRAMFHSPILASRGDTFCKAMLEPRLVQAE